MSASAALLAQGAFDGQGDNSGGIVIVSFRVTPLGNYGALGDILDLSGIAPGGCGLAPLLVKIWSQKSGGVSGFEYAYTPAAVPTQSNGKFQVLTSNGAAPNPLLDRGAVAYDAAILADTIVGFALFTYGV